MFDVGFSEMIVIAIVALVVIGPEKLPKVARTVGALIGRMQRYVNDVKSDISREIELDELKKMHTSVKDAAQSFQSTVNETVAGFESQANAQATELNAAVSGETGVPDGVQAPEPLPVPESLAQAIEAAQADAATWPPPDDPAPAVSPVYAEAPQAVPMPVAEPYQPEPLQPAPMDAHQASLALDLPPVAPAPPAAKPEPAKTAS